MSQVENFKYTLSRQNRIVVAVFSGELNVVSCDRLQECATSIEHDTSFEIVLFDFSNVEQITIDAVPILAQLQKEIRHHGQTLRICGLSDRLKEKLIKLGIIRQNEIAPSLAEGLAILIKKPLAAVATKRAA